MSGSDHPSRALPGGLILRTARPDDLSQIQELLVLRGEEADARDLELMVTDPEAGWGLCAVVVDGTQVVSTASLMDEQVHFGGRCLLAGQVELVATRIGYEGRGLVRELMRWAHELSAARGHVLQVMIGIPYFYRLFGYEYAIDIPKPRAVLHVPPLDRLDSNVFRPATTADLAALAQLQDRAQSSFDLSVQHSAPRRRWLLEHDSSTTYVLQRAGIAVGTARIQADESGVLVAEAAAADAAAADALLAGACSLRPGVPVTVVDRVATVPSTAWDARLGAPDGSAAQYYLRIPDPVELFDALRPLLFQRISGLAGPVEEIVISTFGRHYRMSIEAAGLGAVRAGGAMQAPSSTGGAGVAPDQLAPLMFGPLGLAGLAARRPDVYAGPHRELYEALFPPVTADLLTFYLPF